MIMFVVVLPIWRYTVKPAPAQQVHISTVEKKGDPISTFSPVEIVDWGKPPIWAYK